jgi:hypothetical protein
MKKSFIVVLTVIVLMSLVVVKADEIVHDADNDGLLSDVDNCPLSYNPMQEDFDGDGVGDLCDASPGIKIGPVINVPNQTNQTQDEDRNNRRSRGDEVNMLDFNFCEPLWQCSNFGECNGGVRQRNCVDINRCDFQYNRPAETTGCREEIAGKAVIEEENTNFSTLFLFLGISLVLIIVLGILLMKI